MSGLATKFDLCPPCSMPLTLTRTQLTNLKACKEGLDWFDSRAVSGQIVYPNGFDASEIQRLGTDQPRFFKWMARSGLIPGVSLAQARQLVHTIHGTDPGMSPGESWRLD
jgi:hypothetical protein